MSSPVASALPEDDPMDGGEHSEAEGDIIMPETKDDSSEEEEDDQEEEARIRDGFIVDEDEEDEEEVDQGEERRRKRRKRRHRRRQQEQELEEDDLDLLEENTGASFKKSRLKRLRRGRDSDSPQPELSSQRHQQPESSEDDLDLPQVKDIHDIWDDEQGGDADEDMDDFIDDDEQGGRDNEDRSAQKSMKPKRKRAFKGRPDLEGMDALAWDEIHDVFGDGHEYDWALDDDKAEELDDIVGKPELKYTDVFEPSVLRSRYKTDEDEVIRVQDIPERMQLSVSGLSTTTALSTHEPLSEDDLPIAASWVTERISPEKSWLFFISNSRESKHQEDLVNAVTYALRQLFVKFLEVPYVWQHKRDYFSTFSVDDPQTRTVLLTEDELWRVYDLGQQYRAVVNRLTLLHASYVKLGVSDDYFDLEIRPKIETVEDAIDAGEWLTLKYRGQKQGGQSDYRFYDDVEPLAGPKHKLPTRISAYEVAKRSIVSKLANGFGIQSYEVVQNFVASMHLHAINDQDIGPLAYADQFVDPDPDKALPAEELLAKARMIIATELGKDPILRHEIRALFQKEATISCVPTEKGIFKIDKFNKVYPSKYLLNKRIVDMQESPQFLNILKAESDGNLTVSVQLPLEVFATFERRLTDAFASEGFSESVQLWNAERLLVVREALEKHLVPAGVKWAREYLAKQEEEFLAEWAGEVLRDRIDIPPYPTNQKDHGKGATPTVLAVSWGKGEAHKDPIAVVLLDSFSRVRDHTTIDNLVDQDNRDEFMDLLSRRTPDVIVVGGFSAATAKLSSRVKEMVLAQFPPTPPPPDAPPEWEQTLKIPVIYAPDDVARLYMQSERAELEFPSLTKVHRYCVALGRYIQSPLNEFAALGEDIGVIRFNSDDHEAIPRDKLLRAYEKVLVTMACKVGIDINRAVGDPYYAHLLPLVCGLGRRKADLLVSRINSSGGNLINRDQFVKSDLLTHTIFMNAASFLRIAQDSDERMVKSRAGDDDVQDPLDNTRVHPEDYDLARKMATDALELDEEDIHDEHPSHVVTLLLHDRERNRKVNELNLDEFAISLLEANQERKRSVLNIIRDELVNPYGELRGLEKRGRALNRREKHRDHRCVWDKDQTQEEKNASFWDMTGGDVLLQLTGDTENSVGHGCPVTATVTRISKGLANLRLDSGLEGTLSSDFVSDEGLSIDQVLTKGKTVQGAILSLTKEPKADLFTCEISLRQSDFSAEQRGYPKDLYWDINRDDRDQELLARKKKAEVNRTRRVIKHPNFHNFNSAQAETFLEQQQRGDVVIRPSSKGQNHLAVTWKVDSGLYQHIDVTEPNADIAGQSVSELIVDNAHRYTDLDELIVNHVQAIARRVEELMAHDKFKPGAEDELHLYLKNYLLANPSKSMYGFTLNRKKPGHFNLCFLANKDSPVQTWPVRVTPEAYYLFEAPAAGVPELCDAFKVRYIHLQQSQSMGGGAAGGKTPYGRTPGHASVRQSARTPNPYGGATSTYNGSTSAVGASSWGGSTSYAGAPPPSSWGGASTAPQPPPASAQFPAQTPAWGGSQTPRGFQPPPPPSQASGMHPSRLEMLQQQNSSSSWGPGWS